MTPNALDALRSRIRRMESTVRKSESSGYEQTHNLDDGTSHQYTINGVKSAEQLEDELLMLFIWIWSLKDHLKEMCKAKHLDPRLVEEVVNKSQALQYVADIANRAKHGVLRESRSGAFAELVGVGFSVPQSAISKITIGAFSVGIDVEKSKKVQLHAFVKPTNCDAINAFTLLTEALNTWDVSVIEKIRS